MSATPDPTPPEAVAAGRRRWRRAIGTVLAIVAAGWAAWLLRDALKPGTLARMSLDAGWGAAAFVLLLVSLLLSFVAFAHVMRAVGANMPSLPAFAHLHFVAQLMKHLPGRFFGVAYQVAAARDVATVQQWLQGNVAYSALVVACSIVVPVLVLAARGAIDSVVSVALVAAFATAVLAAFAVRRVLASARGGGPIRSALLGAWRAVTGSGAAHACAWLAASWLVYLGAWAAVGIGLPGHGPGAALELAAWYSLAWAIGFLSFVTPSGLGVRELAFAFMASRFAPETIAWFAVVARLGMLSADIVLGIVFMAWRRHA